MVKLRCESFAERALIPAFIFFFEMLYPFDWVRRRDRRTAAAAGGCMLARRDALAAIGGIESIRGALIDDCALARADEDARADLARPHRTGAQHARVPGVRGHPPHGGALGLRAAAIFAGCCWPERWRAWLSSISRRSCWRCSATALPQTAGLLVWAGMAIAFQPVLKFYKLSPFWGPLLPAIALAYMAFTLNSAYQNARGQGGLWKGRVQANATEIR